MEDASFFIKLFCREMFWLCSRANYASALTFDLSVYMRHAVAANVFRLLKTSLEKFHYTSKYVAQATKNLLRLLEDIEEGNG